MTSDKSKAKITTKKLKDPEFAGQEKRYLPRWEVNNRILYSVDRQRKSQEALSKDISCTGACIFTEKEVPTKHKVKLTIYLSKNISVNVEGEVVWSKSSGEEFQIGINFTNISPDVQERILNHAFSLNRDELLRHWFQGWNNN